MQMYIVLGLSLIHIFIQSGASQEREPVYLQTAASHDGPDFGNTYVEMNLTSQHILDAV